MVVKKAMLFSYSNKGDDRMIKIMVLCMLLHQIILPAKQNTFKASYVYAIGNEKALYEANAHQHYDPKDLTQLVSLMIIYEAIQSQQLKLDEMIMISDVVSKVDDDKLNLQEHQCISVKDLILCIIHKSSYDAVMVLAHRIAGSHEAFVAKMNQKVKELQCKDTHFMNAYGAYHHNQYSCAKDLAMIFAYLIEMAGSSFLALYEQSEVILTSLNDLWIVSDHIILKQYFACDGAKMTSYSNGQSSIVASAIKNNVRCIVVGLYADDIQTAYQSMILYFEEVFQKYKSITVIKKDEYQGIVTVFQGNKDHIQYTHDELQCVVAKQEQLSIEHKQVIIKPLIAPIKKHQKVGTLKVTLSNKKVYYLGLYTREEIHHQSFLQTFYQLWLQCIS